jgi:hypothetical protein
MIEGRLTFRLSGLKRRPRHQQEEAEESGQHQGDAEMNNPDGDAEAGH